MLNLARSIYSCWDNKNQKLELPEAEIIPMGDSVNEKRKLISISKRFPIINKHENIPLPGFTLFKTNRKRWGSMDQTWLVIDPRGFLVRITNENLENILHVTGITEGLIQEKCVWARVDSQTRMTLIPVSSPSYLDAVRNTELIESKVSMRDVQIGDKVLLQNELTGTYMGVISLYGCLYNGNSYSEYKPQIFLRRQILEVSDGKYYHQNDLKILKVIEKCANPWSKEESIQKINQKISEGNYSFSTIPSMSQSFYSPRGQVRHASNHALSKVTMTKEEITREEAINIFNKQYLQERDIGIVLLEHQQLGFGLFDYPFNILSSGPTSTIQSFEVCFLDNNDIGEKIILKDERRINKKSTHYSIDKFKKFFKIIKHVKDETYI